MKKLLIVLCLSIICSNNKFLIQSIILDIKNDPIKNVNINCGDNITLSNEKGYFEIYCSENDSIYLSHIKYNNKTITKSDSRITLFETYINFNDVKVFGGLNTFNTDNVNIIPMTDENSFLSGKNKIENVLNIAPNINYSGGTSNPRYFQIRGLGELSQFSGEGPPHFSVGYIVDYIDFSGLASMSLLNDVKQVEIFKGPQTSTFGPNTSAGAINIVTKNPDTTQSYINTSLSIENYDGASFTSTINSKISSKLFTRTTLSRNENNGQRKNVFKNSNITNAKNESLLKHKILFNISNNFDFKLNAFYIYSNNKYDVWTPDNNGFETYTDYQGLDKQTTNAYSLISTYAENNIKIKFISTYSKNNIIYSYDGDWANNNYWLEEPYSWDPNVQGYEWSFIDYTYRQRKTYTNELRLVKNHSSFVNILGIYNSYLVEEDNRQGWLFAGLADNINSKFKINNYAIYFQNQSKTNNTIFTTSLRYDINETKHDLNYDSYNWYTYENNNTVIPSITNKDKNLIGGSFRINTQINNNLNFFGIISRGHKTSGINQSPNFLNNKTYETEFINNIEFGINYTKTNKYKLSIFYINRVNPQLRIFSQFDLLNPTSFDYATFNAKSGNNYGIEFNSEIKIKNSILKTNIGMLDTHIDEFIFLDNTYGNRDLAHSPKITINNCLDVNLVKFISGLHFELEHTFKDKFYFDDQNNHMSKPFNIFNINLNYMKNNFGISLWSKNITNERYAIRGYTFILDPTNEVKNWKSFGDLRTIGLSINLKL